MFGISHLDDGSALEENQEGKKESDSIKKVKYKMTLGVFQGIRGLLGDQICDSHKVCHCSVNIE